MPNQEDMNAYRRFMETGVCACGQHYDKHVDHLDGLKEVGSINCKLTKAQVALWNTPRQQSAA